MLAFHARVSLCSGQSEKRNSLPDDESLRLIGEHISDIISYFCSIQTSFISHAILLLYTKYKMVCSILIFNYLYSSYI